MHVRDLTRIPILIAALFALILGGWIGLARMGWPFPAPALIQHGPLMVSGFFGTLIGMERAVAIQKRWAYAGPALSAVGAVLLLVGLENAAKILMSFSAAFFVGVSIMLAQKHRSLFTVLLALGALLWLVGNGLWLVGGPIYRSVHWWIAYLVVTIAGERLELARVLRISQRASLALAGIILLLLAGLVMTLWMPGIGVRVAGTAYVLLSVWLLIFDVTRRTIRQTGLPRFVAIALISGYVWLFAGGLMALVAGGDVAAGLMYDAMLHSLLIGFIFSMIFAHAPIILPALLNRPVAYEPVLYAPLALLHASAILRIGSDLLSSYSGRQWGGMINAIAILAYLGMMAALNVRAAAGASRASADVKSGI